MDDKNLIKVNFVHTNFDDWCHLVAEVESENLLASRVLANLSPIAIINGTLYIKYSGKEEYRGQVMDGYRTQKIIIERAIMNRYNVSSIANGAELDSMKINWLNQLISQFKPLQVNVVL